MAAEHPGVVACLRRVANGAQARPGPGGPARRPPGRVANPQPLTRCDPSHRRFAAGHDLRDFG